VRYADDFVLVVNGQRPHAEALRGEVAQVIAPLGLHLAPDKTRVVHIGDGFDFLGWHIRRMRKRGTRSKQFVYTIPSRKAVQAIRDRIKQRTSRSTLHQDLDQLLLAIKGRCGDGRTTSATACPAASTPLWTITPGGG
jgi:RNA-directed DNA polymerase